LVSPPGFLRLSPLGRHHLSPLRSLWWFRLQLLLHSPVSSPHTSLLVCQAGNQQCGQVTNRLRSQLCIQPSSLQVSLRFNLPANLQDSQLRCHQRSLQGSQLINHLRSHLYDHQPSRLVSQAHSLLDSLPLVPATNRRLHQPNNPLRNPAASPLHSQLDSLPLNLLFHLQRSLPNSLLHIPLPSLLHSLLGNLRSNQVHILQKSPRDSPPAAPVSNRACSQPQCLRRNRLECPPPNQVLSQVASLQLRPLGSLQHAPPRSRAFHLLASQLDNLRRILPASPLSNQRVSQQVNLRQFQPARQ
jgi:hypothetical protein